MTGTAFLEKLLDQVVWEPVESSELTDANQSSGGHDSDLCATHKGLLKVEDFEIGCYRLANGEIALDIEDIERFFAGCPLCNHSSRCPDCNPTQEERNRLRVGVQLEN